jgi:membrane protease YdiL (CAAX protease family)
MQKIDLLYFVLPIVLWPVVFLVFNASFIYAMSVAAVILALFTVWRHREFITWKKKKSFIKIITMGIIGAIILYLIFLMGYYLATYLGLVQYVHLVYSLIYSQASTMAIAILLALIGICEEIYWRGGVQGYIEKNSKRFKSIPWAISTAYYSIVHLTTLNPILVLAAFFVGLTTSLLAKRYGIAASAIAHVFWIEAIIIFLPVIAIH